MMLAGLQAAGGGGPAGCEEALRCLFSAALWHPQHLREDVPQRTLQTRECAGVAAADNWTEGCAADAPFRRQ